MSGLLHLNLPRAEGAKTLAAGGDTGCENRESQHHRVEGREPMGAPHRTVPRVRNGRYYLTPLKWCASLLLLAGLALANTGSRCVFQKSQLADIIHF